MAVVVGFAVREHVCKAAAPADEEHQRDDCREHGYGC